MGAGTQFVAIEPPSPPIDIGRIVGTSFRIYLRCWRPHLLTAIFSQLPALIPILALVSRLIDATVDVLLQRTVDALWPAAGLTLVLLLVSCFSAFLFVVMSGVVCQLVRSWLEGERPSVVAAYVVALAKFWRLAGAMLLAFIIIFGGLVVLGLFLALCYVGFLVIFQIDLASDPRLFWATFVAVGLAALAATVVLVDATVRWSVFVQAVMIEGAGSRNALTRSAALVRGNWWRTAAALLLLLLVPMFLMSALSTLLNLALSPIVRAGMASADVINGLAIAIAQVSLSPVAAIGVTLLFYRLRDGSRIWSRIDDRLRDEAPHIIGDFGHAD